MKIKTWKELELLHPELETLKQSYVWKLPDIDAGWFDLINWMMNELKDSNLLTNDFAVVQVKEKFGGLRFYCDGLKSSKAYDIVHKYEELSFITCEKCGSKGKLRTSGWYVTLCDNCYKNYRRK